MLARFYLYLKDKIEIIEARLTSNFANHSSGLNPRIFFFQTIRLNLALIILEILSDVIKFVIILFADTSNGFNVIFKQRELKTCPYSYHSYKAVQAKVKLFSFGGASAIVLVAVITSLITNLIFGGKQPSFAATYGWLQTTWSASSTDLASHISDQENWNKFENKDNSVTLANGGADLQLLRTSGILGETNYADFFDGTSNPASSTQIMGTGDEASVQISEILTATKQVATGMYSNVCALKTDGTVYCWGNNTDGQGGDGGLSTARKLPLQVLGANGVGFLSGVKSISVGGSHVCGVKDDGTVWCWGNNGYGRLGDGTVMPRSFPVRAGTLSDVAQVIAGAESTCAIKNDGTIWCWGNFLYNYTTNSAPVQAAILDGAVQISIGAVHSCAVKNDGTAWCWGANSFGQLGNSTTTATTSMVQVSMLENNVSQIFASNYYGTCAVKTDSTVWCWGRNNGGQLGDGTSGTGNAKVIPGRAGTLTGVVHVNLQGSNACAFKNNGEVWCWGDNSNGQLGDGTIITRTLPVQAILWGTSSSQISVSGGYVCSLKNDGTTWCLGGNYNGQLGDGTLINRTSPVQVKGSLVVQSADFTQVSGGYRSTCALKNDGTAWCWGRNTSGQLGINSVAQHSTPVQLSTLAGITQIESSAYFACALKDDGTVWCWGDNASGRLGDGTEIQRNLPVQVSGLTNVEKIATGGSHVCARKNDDSVWCWGANTYGQLGDNTTTKSTVPVQSVALSGAMQVVAGGSHTCALKTDGTVWCVGYNLNGQIGNGTTTNQLSPVQVSVLTGVTQISSGPNASHTCAQKNDMSAWCWGQNTYGQLGNNTQTSSNIPVNIVSDVAMISVGTIHTCAVKTDGSAWCWGDNSLGKLGDNTVSLRKIPVPVNSLGSGTTALISAGSAHTCAVKIDNSVWCWGSDEYGSLGILYNTALSRSVPGLLLEQVEFGNLLLSVKQPSGTYISNVLDMTHSADFTTLSYTSSVPTGTTFSVDIKAGNTDTPDENWLEISDAANGQDLSALDGKRYVQYQLNMTADVSNTLSPSLSDIAINYNYYQNGSLYSSPYNSTDIANILAGFSWQESLATSTGVTLFLRSASTSAELVGASWLEIASSTNSGLSTADCAKDGGTGQVSCSLNTIPTDLRDGVGDQWFQYQIALSSDGVYTPTFSELNLTYVVNATPEVTITNSPITQSTTDGKIVVDYQVRDTDTNTGRTAGYVNLTLEYCTANCTATGSESWSVASEAALAGNFGASTTVDLASTTTWTSHSLTWDPNVDFEGQYIPTDFKIRLVANDSEGANNIGYSQSNYQLLDTANPAAGASGVLAKVEATANPALVTMDATDDTTLYMKVGLNADLSDAPSWLPYVSTTTINLTTDPDTVYVQFKDEYNNLTDISPVTPETPINMVIRDLTNSDVGSFMEFIAWKVVTTPGPGFKQYNIWRGEGTDTVPPESYSLLATIGSSSKNYHLDTTVVTGTTYYYKIASEDSNGNQSYFSQIVKDAPDGQGGTDNTPPTIKQVEVVATSTQSATIEWDTDELSDSLVGYSLTESDFSDMLGIDTMANYSTSTATSHGYDPQAANGRHRVTLSGLTPGTTYYFKVKSTDPQGNYAEDTNGGPGFSFTTKPGPRMQFGPIVTSINNRQAVINWQTDILANATVVYATNTDFTDSKTASTTDFLIDQQVTVADLQAETKYYFYIKNQDEQGNESIIKKVENGIESYYDFTTTNDANPPLIEEVTCSILSDTSLSIKWKTTAAGSGKPATARVDYGSQSGSYASSTETAMEYNADHTVELSDLLASSTYYFQVVSTDLNGNTATSSEYSCGTSEELVPKTEADKLIQEAKATGKSEGLASAPGGGIMTIDKTDKTAPIISDIRITDLTATSARVSWVTNEEADSLVKFGVVNFDDGSGDDVLLLIHDRNIKNLLPNTKYNYQISSTDSSGNTARSNNLTFQTPVLSAEEALALSTSTVPGTKEDKETLMKSIAEKAIAIISSLANQVSLGSLENTLLSQYDALEKLAQIIPAPVLSGEPNVDTSPTTATIRWTTDKKANSLVAYTPETLFIKSKNDEAYIQVVGQSKEDVTAHNVKIYNLKPETVYHFQLRSQSNVGPDARSRNFTFKTKPDALEIVSFNSEILSPEKAQFNWLTSLEADTQITYTPYRAGKLSLDELKTISNKALSVNHEMVLNELESGAVYQVELASTDKKGIKVSNIVNFFSTTKDDLPPTIDNIQTESALSQGKDLKVQTAISWITNEPTACALKYAKGSTQVETDLTEETLPEASYSRKHALVITKFELGSVYSFRIYCTDSGDNQTISEPHAILTPKQRDSVFDLIINTMEQTFGWIGKLKG